jgi:hypothetical protein
MGFICVASAGLRSTAFPKILEDSTFDLTGQRRIHKIVLQINSARTDFVDYESMLLSGRRRSANEMRDG